MQPRARAFILYLIQNVSRNFLPLQIKQMSEAVKVFLHSLKLDYVDTDSLGLVPDPTSGEFTEVQEVLTELHTSGVLYTKPEREGMYFFNHGYTVDTDARLRIDPGDYLWLDRAAGWAWACLTNTDRHPAEFWLPRIESARGRTTRMIQTDLS